MVRYTANRSDVGRLNADPGFRFDAGAQFQVAQRIEAVLGQGTVRVDSAAQNQADLFGDQAPEAGWPLVERKLGELGTELAVIGSVDGLESVCEAATLRQGG